MPTVELTKSQSKALELLRIQTTSHKKAAEQLKAQAAELTTRANKILEIAANDEAEMTSALKEECGIGEGATKVRTINDEQGKPHKIEWIDEKPKGRSRPKKPRSKKKPRKQNKKAPAPPTKDQPSSENESEKTND